MHIMNGETHFPTAMSYLSDAQRSDVATVCSGSVVEDDIEIESVMSQEDQHNNVPTGAYRQIDRSSVQVKRSAGNSSNRIVDSDNAPHNDFTHPYKIPLLFHQIEHSETSLAVTPPGGHEANSNLTHKSMGPPLHRGAMHDAALHKSGSQSDCGGSVEAEAHSVYSQEDTPVDELRRSSASSTANEHRFSKLYIATTKSCGSTQGSDHGPVMDMDDCGGSLDVETHSIETRSNNSQEDSAVESKHRAATEEATPSPFLMLSSSSGRRSPGGTIYKGRGERRYTGRYMHLPLKRFHNDGVHLESVAMYDTRKDSGRGRDRTDTFSRRYTGEHLPRRLSRSRSRSPSTRLLEDADMDKKLPAHRCNTEMTNVTKVSEDIETDC